MALLALATPGVQAFSTQEPSCHPCLCCLLHGSHAHVGLSASSAHTIHKHLREGMGGNLILAYKVMPRFQASEQKSIQRGRLVNCPMNGHEVARDSAWHSCPKWGCGDRDMEVCVRVQVMVVPISAVSADYAKEVKAALRSCGFSADIDTADSKMEKKIREAQLEQYNYIVVRLPGCPLLRPGWADRKSSM